MAQHGHGVIVLMHRAECGEDLITRLTGNAPRTQTKWDPRTYGIGAQILRDVGVSKMRLLSSPRKMPSMTGFGLSTPSTFARSAGSLHRQSAMPRLPKRGPGALTRLVPAGGIAVIMPG